MSQKEQLMSPEERAIIIDALSNEIMSCRVVRPYDKETMLYVIGMMDFRDRLMVAQLADQAAETHRLNGIINHPPREVTP